MKVTIARVNRALDRAILDQQRFLAVAAEREDWREAAERDAYLRGLLFSKEVIGQLQIEED